MTDDARPTPLEVRILSQRSRGLLVGLLDGSETGWLPCNEWSYDAEAWRADSALVLTGTLLKVVPWDQTLTSGLRAYSRRRVAHDPWRLVTQAWIGEYRQFTVTGLTREFATGEIEPGLQARVRRNAFRSLGVEGVQGLSEAELGHSVISIGDTVAGLVSEIAFPEESTRPSLCLDPRQLLARLATDPAMLLPAASEPRSALLAGLKDAASVRTPPPLELIWVIDDDQEFREATAAYLRSLGYTVFAAPSGADIVALEKEPSTDPDLIIIDVHLTEDSANHDGLQLAAELSKRLPRAKLLVVSGEDSLTPRSGITERKIREYGTLLVGGYLPKPFTVDELETYISDATSRPRRRFADCLSATIPSVAKAQATVPIIQASPGRARPARFSIEDALRDLHSYSEKSSFHLFEMNPLNGRGRSLAHVGDPHPWQVVAHKLQKSSVRDTAIDPERAEWYDEDIHASPGLQRKHFWLLQARQYRSAMGIPVETASPEGHCLLGFNPAPKGISASLSHAARLCAERLARAIEWQRLQRQSSERASYEKAGMAFAFLAHELGADLSAIDMTVSTLSRALDARPGNAQDVMPATVSRLKGMSHDAVEKMQLLL
ncbi:MAG: response regulator [Holophagales bacterium]|nr:response regulator [Holophagales bacterium]